MELLVFLRLRRADVVACVQRLVGQRFVLREQQQEGERQAGEQGAHGGHDSNARSPGQR